MSQYLPRGVVFGRWSEGERVGQFAVDDVDEEERCQYVLPHSLACQATAIYLYWMTKASSHRVVAWWARPATGSGRSSRRLRRRQRDIIPTADSARQGGYASRAR